MSSLSKVIPRVISLFSIRCLLDASVNSDFVRHNRSGLLLVIFTIFSLFAMTLRVDPYVVGIKTVIWYMFSPETVYSGKFFNQLDSLRGQIFRLFRRDGENFVLRQKIEMLTKRGLERDALERENNRLRSLLNFRERRFPDAIPAEVVGRDVRDWFHSVVINKGKEDGIVFSAAVVTGTADQLFLVGRVKEVYARTSKVLLLTDAMSAISATVRGRGDIGLLEGRNRSWLLLNYLAPNSEVVAGDSVLTVGLGGVFPPGIPIGIVDHVKLTPDAYFKTAKVIPLPVLNSLREVLVLRRENLGERVTEQ